ncbi:M23 family metallopeptidase [filamentous cyanobacterium LEGE 11480]|uniref:M23 family metallopeptidase n=1 Tax=Romeriopsis navalis LEGE 11480 TaxID=2777977 RepID=A0A928Z3N7_9CYAN|nr:M23 family metallopeptidase [Romeriopsis navalis]MBE9029480.1 M23 family metallopeptidase [Romeriopsis navalis LEGE 11480]
MASKRTFVTTSVLATSWLIQSYAAVAQTPVVEIAPAPVTAPAPPSVPAAVVEVAPAPARPIPVRSAPIPAAPVAPAPVRSAPAPIPPAPAPVAPAPVQSAPVVEPPAPLAVDSAEAFIDRSDYNLGATEREEVPVEIITRGQPSKQPIRARSIPAKLPNYRAAQARTSVQVGSINLSSAGIGWKPQAAPPSAASIVSPSRSYLNRKFLKPLGSVTQKALRMAFPVAIPAPITSLFGWRIHPISGAQKLHTGTDIGAPMGTPVMAAMTGRVILADQLGGYGITVALEHDNGMRQTLYAHMSELFVRPGDVVQQGTVIGRVGSTGASTGPHLHFELRQMMPDGTWVAMDSGEHLNNSMGNLVRSLQIAQQQRQTALRPTPPNVSSETVKPVQ